jgi:hypothetical protein
MPLWQDPFDLPYFHLSRDSNKNMRIHLTEREYYGLLLPIGSTFQGSVSSSSAIRIQALTAEDWPRQQRER